MKKFLLSVLVLLLVFSLAGCLAKDAEESVQMITSEETSLSMEFPTSWKKSDLNSDATIQMARLEKEQYLIVFEESTVDFIDEITLDEYVDLAKYQMEAGVETTSEAVVKDVKLGTDIVAKQFELEGVVDKIKVKYLVTCVENDDYFYQFITWSLQSKYDECKPVFDQILNSIAF